MTEEQKAITWDDLANVETFETQIVECPNLSARTGKSVAVKVRALAPMDLLKASDFPLDEIRALARSDAENEAYARAWQEHVGAMEVEDLTDMMRGVVQAGLVEPDPQKGDIAVFEKDFPPIFKAILSLTMGEAAVDEAGAFPSDGEREGA